MSFGPFIRTDTTHNFNLNPAAAIDFDPFFLQENGNDVSFT